MSLRTVAGARLAVNGAAETGGVKDYDGARAPSAIDAGRGDLCRRPATPVHQRPVRDEGTDMTPEAFTTLIDRLAPDAQVRLVLDTVRFCVGAKAFATLNWPVPGWAVLKLTPADQQRLVARCEGFMREPGRRRSGVTLVRLEPSTTWRWPMRSPRLGVTPTARLAFARRPGTSPGRWPRQSERPPLTVPELGDFALADGWRR